MQSAARARPEGVPAAVRARRGLHDRCRELLHDEVGEVDVVDLVLVELRQGSDQGGLGLALGGLFALTLRAGG